MSDFSEEIIQKPKFKPARISKGDTVKIVTPCGTLYMTINFSEQDHNKGLPFEVFVHYGKNGGCVASSMVILGRFLSLSLRAGVDLSKVARQLIGTRCLKFIDEEKLSCYHLLGLALQNYVTSGDKTRD